MVLTNAPLLPYYVETAEHLAQPRLPENTVPMAACPHVVAPAKSEFYPVHDEPQTQLTAGLLCAIGSLYPLSDAGDLEMALLVQQLLVGEARL